jgi:hypothetical protein
MWDLRAVVDAPIERHSLNTEAFEASSRRDELDGQCRLRYPHGPA